VDVLTRAPVPVVFIDVHTPSIEAMPRVIGDDEAGGAMAASHLFDLGHREIAFIGDALEDPFGFTSSTDREAGFRRELAASGVNIPADRVGHGAHGRYEARDLARRMLTDDDRPTAIFAASDTQAFGVVAAARDLGLGVPDDLSVIGYDDIEAADYVGLTTIRQQLFESGRRGAEILLAEIEGRSPEPAIAQLEPELVARATTAPAKEGRG
jgi:DNA-binding LacI/PurR family transcriptional regulator